LKVNTPRLVFGFISSELSVVQLILFYFPLAQQQAKPNKMCCDFSCRLQTNVLVISSLCLLFTGFSFGYSAKKVILSISHPNGLVSVIGIGILVLNVFGITSQILSIVGSSKNNKCLLIPFIIWLALQLLAFVGSGIYCGMVNMQLLIIPLAIGCGITTSFLVTVVRFYKALLSRANLQPDVELQPYERPAGDGHSTACVTTSPQNYS
jgi:hypothetical protein